jgi:Fanconi-associated nuclease 1
MRAGANVEICKVVDQDAALEQKKRKRETPGSKPKKTSRKGKGKANSDDREAQEQQHHNDLDDDGDYLPQPPTKRRKMSVGRGGRCAITMTPMSGLTNAPPASPLSSRHPRTTENSLSQEL